MDTLDLGRGIQTAGNIFDPDFQSAQILRRIEEQNMTIINQNSEIVVLLRAINFRLSQMGPENLKI